LPIWSAVSVPVAAPPGGGVRALHVKLVPAGGIAAGGWRPRSRAPKNVGAVCSHRALKLGKIHLVYIIVWDFFYGTASLFRPWKL
jgi:hypothetical protein